MRLDNHDIELEHGETVGSVWALPDGFRRGQSDAAVLAHGAGSDMNQRFIRFFHEGLARAGLLAVRFNFPYKEKGRKAPDPAPKLESCFRRVLGEVRREARPRRLFAGGKSMGGRIASHLAAQGEAIDGLFLLGYPLHPPNRPDRPRTDHLGAIRCPTLFVQGSRDALCRLDLLGEALEKLAPKPELHVVEGGDHSFKTPKRSGTTEAETLESVLEILKEWLRRH